MSAVDAGQECDSVCSTLLALESIRNLERSPRAVREEIAPAGTRRGASHYGESHRLLLRSGDVATVDVRKRGRPTVKSCRQRVAPSASPHSQTAPGGRERSRET